MSDPIPVPEPLPEKRPAAWVTWALLGSTIAVFLYQLYDLRIYGSDVVGDDLAFSPDSLADHRYWTLITYAWAHAVAIFGRSDLFWLHIAANMIILYSLGPALEDLLGHWRFLALYLGGAIAAALVWCLFTPEYDEGQGIIGASGAVFALIAAAGTAAPGEQVTLYVFAILPINMTLRTMALVVSGLEMIQYAFGWLPQIAHTAHLGGALFGFLYITIIRFCLRWTRRRAVHG
jgi:membrane associated rhomboid family serine protease